MAILHAKSREVGLVLRPYRLADEEPPSWILTQLELWCGGTLRSSATVSLARADLVEIRRVLDALARGRQECAFVESTDGDFILVGRGAALPWDVFVGFWIGEPSGLMQGYRFVATKAAVAEFVAELQSEEGAVSRPDASA